MSAGEPTNPYSVSQPTGQYPQSGQQTDYGFQALSPLFEATWWLKLVGWSLIVLGVIYCLTIVGIIFGWLPIWMGVLLKGAGEKLNFGNQSRSWQSIFDGSKDLRTFFIIVGVLMIINLCVLVLYFLFFIVIMLFGLAGAAAGSMGP